MTTRSSRSSLVGPPTTVAEGDDDNSMLGDLPYQDENHRPTWDTGRTPGSCYTYANDALIEDLDNFALSPPIERVIKDFNEELDAFTKTFESLSQRKGRLESTATTTTPRLPYQTQYPSTAKKTMMSPLREKDPPPSVKGISPLRSYAHSTPTKRYGSASYTPSEPPPAPVETPGFAFPTPNRNRTRNTTAPPRGEGEDESSSYQYVASSARYSSREPPHSSNRPRRQGDGGSTINFENNDNYNNHNDNDNNENHKESSNKVEELENKIREQEIRIQDLEIENEVLRKKLQLQPPRVERIHRTSSLANTKNEYEQPEETRAVPPPPSTNNNNHRRRYSVVEEPVEPEGVSRRRGGGGVEPRSDDRSTTVREEPEGRHKPSAAASFGLSQSPYRTQSSFLSTPSRRQQQHQQPIVVDRPPRHIQTLSEAIEETGDQFTPGTRFVSQLATLMKLEKSHYAPLSVIMDKHWDSLKHHFQQDERERFQQ